MHRANPCCWSIGVMVLSLVGCATAAPPQTQKVQTVNLSGDVKLEPKTYTNTQFVIKQSNTHLDCQNALIDGGGVVLTGLRIVSDGSAPLNNVTVKNCRFRNFDTSGIRIYFQGNDTVKLQYSMDERYRLAPQQVKITNVVIEDTAKSGLYVDDYVQDVVLDGLTVRRAGGTGVYLEHHSRRTTIQNSTFEQNGFRDGGKPVREAIAIDSSMYNTIRNNVFRANAKGGVFLYKNCGERFSTGQAVLRTDYSSFNLIENNRFIDMPTGVWLASRQSRKLDKWDCGDTPLDDTGTYFQDYARNNTVQGNTFCNIAKPVIIEDNDNKIVRNRYANAKQMFAEITHPPRAKVLGQKVTGTVLEANTEDAGSCRMQ